MKRRSRALSLIEVVASLALLGGAAAMLLAAQGRGLAQLRGARTQQTATNLAHDLIVSWKLDPAALQSSAEGQFEARPGWRWVRRFKPLVGSDALMEWTLTIYHAQEDATERRVARYTWLERIDTDR